MNADKARVRIIICKGYGGFPSWSNSCTRWSTISRICGKLTRMAAGSIVVLYNTDYDAELMAAGADESSVELSARAIRDALRASEWDANLLGVEGLDVLTRLSELRQQPPMLIFNLCESLSGDARNEIVVPPLLDLFGYAYTGSDALALGQCLHKQRAKIVLMGAGVPTPRSTLIETPDQVTERCFSEHGPIVFLKLAHEDASIGIEATNVCHSPSACRMRVAEMINEFQQPVVLESYVEGREVNVTIVGEGTRASVLPLHEIDFSSMPADRPRIVSYAAKWDEDHVDYGGTKPVPLRGIPEATETSIRDAALTAYRALGLRDYGRVDIRLDRDLKPYVIDVNPNCDISPDAGVARAFAAAGMTFTQMIAAIANSALARRR